MRRGITGSPQVWHRPLAVFGTFTEKGDNSLLPRVPLLVAQVGTKMNWPFSQANAATEYKRKRLAMKVILALSSVALGLLLIGTSAQALTCSEQAAICRSKGGSAAGCAAGVRDCQRTGVYTAPNGSKWRTNGRPGGQKGEAPLSRGFRPWGR
jgi:hypothetical protein